MVLGQAVELEDWVGDPKLARRWDDARKSLMQTADDALWSDQQGLYADTVDRNSFSEHAQCYAVLAGLLGDERRRRVASALGGNELTRGTFYFQHYLFECCRLVDRMDLVEARLEGFYAFGDLGLKTALEKPDPSRSDCHAWASHPLLHVLTTFLGIRPEGFGFDKVVIRPSLGTQREVKGALVHSLGLVRAHVVQSEGRLSGSVELPPGLHGRLVIGSDERQLEPGITAF
jgi:hypothetical protein